MSEALKQILETSAFDRVEEYRWKRKKYLRVFVVGHEEFAWDGPETEQSLKLIDDAYDVTHGRKRKRRTPKTRDARTK